MKRVLVIGYSFADESDVGSLRLRGLCKYLPEFGWESVVITRQSGRVKSCQSCKVIETNYDDIIGMWKKRLFKIGSNQSVKECLGILSDRKNRKTVSDYIIYLAMELLAYPDQEKGWCKYALEAADTIISREGFDAILSSARPFTAHCVAFELHRKYGLPWIADYRDLWTQDHYYNYSPIRRLVERRKEVSLLSEASFITTVSPVLNSRLSEIHKRRIVTVPNGYDPEEINAGVFLTKDFSVVYTGSLYKGKRDPELLFKALKELKGESRIDFGEISIGFAGDSDDWLIESIKEYALEPYVRIYGRICRKAAIELQRSSQLLLLLLWNHPSERGVCTSKIYEYFAARRPILSIGGKDSIVRELLKKTGAGIHVSDLESAKIAISKYYEEYQSKGSVSYNGIETETAKFSHKEMARRFAELLDEISNHDSSIIG